MYENQYRIFKEPFLLLQGCIIKCVCISDFEGSIGCEMQFDKYGGCCEKDFDPYPMPVSGFQCHEQFHVRTGIVCFL